jgi:hypothetical protein
MNTILYLSSIAHSGNAYKSFFVYLAFLLNIQIAVEVHAMQNLNNHYLSTYYLFLNFILLSIFFYYLFRTIQHKIIHVIKFVVPVVTLGILVQYFIRPQLYYEFNSVGLLVTSLIIILYSVLYLFELISKKIAYSYVIAGMLIYFVSSSLIFAGATSMFFFEKELYMLIWKINAVLFIIYQLLILCEWILTFYRKTQAREQ